MSNTKLKGNVILMLQLLTALTDGGYKHYLPETHWKEREAFQTLVVSGGSQHEAIRAGGI